MELLIIHAPFCMSMQTAMLLENPAYCNNLTIQALKDELREDDIEIFNEVNNVLITDQGFYILTKISHVKEYLPKEEHPYLYLELACRFPETDFT
jgi:hypothetical protein